MANPFDDPQDEREGARSEQEPVSGADRADTQEEDAAQHPDNGSQDRRTTPPMARKPSGINPMVWVGTGALVVVLIAVAVLRRSEPQVERSQPDVGTRLIVAEDLKSEIRDLTASVRSRIPQMETEAEERDERIEQVRETLDELARQQGEFQAEQRAAIAALSDTVDSLRATPPDLENDAATPAAVDLERLTAALTNLHRAGDLDLAEARIRLTGALRRAGHSGAELALLRDRALERIGIPFVGAVAEAPLREEDLAVLPEALREPTRELHERNRQRAAEDGRLAQRSDEDMDWLKEQLAPETSTVGERDLQRAAHVARVRMDNVTLDHEAMLPVLIAKRDQMGISPANVRAIEQLVVSESASWSFQSSPGQLLAIIHAISEAERSGHPSTSRAAPAGRPDEEDIDAIATAVRRSVSATLQQGIRNQGELIARGRRAAEAAAQQRGVELGETAISRIVLASVRQELQASASATQQTAEPQGDRGEQRERRRPGVERITDRNARVRDAPELTIGHLRTARHQARYVAWLIAGVVGERMGLDASEPSGMSAYAALWSAAPRLSDASFDAVVSETGSLADYYDIMIEGLTEVALHARDLQVSVPDGARLPEPIAEPVTAVLLGHLIGTLFDDREAILPAAQRLADRLRQEEILAGAQPDRIAAALKDPGLARVAGVAEALELDLVPMVPERAERLARTIGRLIETRETLVGSITTDQPKQDTAIEPMLHEAEENLPLVIAALIARNDNGQTPLPVLERVAEDGSVRYLTYSVANGLLSDYYAKDVLKQIGGLIETDEGLTAMNQAVLHYIPEHVHATWERAQPDVAESNIGRVGLDIADAGRDPVNALAIQKLIYSNVEPRIQRAGGSLQGGAIDRAAEHLRVRLEEIVEPPYSIARIDEWTQTMHQEALDVLEGRSRGRRADVRGDDRTQTGNRPVQGRPAVEDVPDAGLPGIPVGMQEVTMGEDQTYAIPRGSLFEIYNVNGTVIAIDGESSDFIQLRGTGRFYSPSGRFYDLPPVVFQGVVSPNVGGSRTNIELQRLTIEFPSGLVVDKEITGIAADTVDGIAGALSDFNLNIEKVLPAALGVGTVQGLSAALDNTQDQNVTVVDGSAVIDTNDINALEQGVSEGLSEGTDIIAEYVRSYMDSISPTVETPNGQPLVGVMGSTVVLDEVSDADLLDVPAGGLDDGF